MRNRVTDSRSVTESVVQKPTILQIVEKRSFSLKHIKLKILAKKTTPRLDGSNYFSPPRCNKRKRRSGGGGIRELLHPRKCWWWCTYIQV